MMFLSDTFAAIALMAALETAITVSKWPLYLEL